MMIPFISLTRLLLDFSLSLSCHVSRLKPGALSSVLKLWPGAKDFNAFVAVETSCDCAVFQFNSAVVTIVGCLKYPISWSCLSAKTSKFYQQDLLFSVLLQRKLLVMSLWNPVRIGINRLTVAYVHTGISSSSSFAAVKFKFWIFKEIKFIGCIFSSGLWKSKIGILTSA